MAKASVVGLLIFGVITALIAIILIATKTGTQWVPLLTTLAVASFNLAGTAYFVYEATDILQRNKVAGGWNPFTAIWGELNKPTTLSVTENVEKKLGKSYTRDALTNELESELLRVLPIVRPQLDAKTKDTAEWYIRDSLKQANSAPAPKTFDYGPEQARNAFLNVFTDGSVQFDNQLLKRLQDLFSLAM